MFPQCRKLKNESGIVLFIVLMTAIIILIIAVSVFTQTANEINYSQQQIDQSTCDQIKSGIFWNAYASNSLPSGTTTTTVNNRVYTISTSSVVNATYGNNWQVNCSYDTFQ